MLREADTRVLVVDSDAAMQATLQSMLGQHGCTVTLASSIAEAVAAFDAKHPPLVIAACMLSDGVGAELIMQLRAQADGLPIILTGDHAPDPLLLALRAASTDYLPRPIAETDLVAALARAQAAQDAWSARSTREQMLSGQIATLQAMQASLVQIATLGALSRLAASLAHEINNPLTPIFGMADLLLDDLPSDHSCRPYAEAIASSARRIRDVVRSLIDFARPTPEEHVRLELGMLIRDTLLLTEQRLHDHAINIIVDLPAEPIIIMGSPAQLKQALLGMIDNAQEAMPNGGSLSVRLFALDDAGSTPLSKHSIHSAIIAIHDTGQGIDAQRLPYIFEPFYSTKQQVVGVGLGLAVANSILQEHGGAIEVESAVGQGSTFRMRLPVEA